MPHRGYTLPPAEVKALAKNRKVALTIDKDTYPPKVLLVRDTAEVEMVDGVAPEYLQADPNYLRYLFSGHVQSRWTNLPGSSEITLLQRFYEHEAIFGRRSRWSFLEGDDFEHALYLFFVCLDKVVIGIYN